MQEGQQKYHGQGEIAEVFVEQVTLCQNVVDDGSDYFLGSDGNAPGNQGVHRYFFIAGQPREDGVISRSEEASAEGAVDVNGVGQEKKESDKARNAVQAVRFEPDACKNQKTGHGPQPDPSGKTDA